MIYGQQLYSCVSVTVVPQAQRFIRIWAQTECNQRTKPSPTTKVGNVSCVSKRLNDRTKTGSFGNVDYFFCNYPYW